MTSTLFAVLADGLLYATTAVVLCLGAREFRLFNLAAGAWLIIGGWIAASLLGWANGVPTPVNETFYLVIALLALGQAAAPLLLRQTMQQSPMSYVFIGLGTSITLVSFGASYLLHSAGDTIPIFGSVPKHATALIVGSVASIAVVYAVFRSWRWARVAIHYRSSLPHRSIWIFLSLTIAAEILLLLVLGGVSQIVHKGVFYSAEYRTVIPIVAVAASGGRPLRAAVASFAIILIAHGITILVPPLSQFAVVISIAGSLVFYLFVTRGQRLRTFTPRTIDAGYLSAMQTPIFQDATVLGFLSLVVASVVVAGVAGAEQNTTHHALAIAGLAYVAWLAKRTLGVESITWPVAAGLALYLVASTDGVWTPILLVGLMVLWGTHLYVLRSARRDTAMIVDLAVVVMIHQLVTSLESLSGQQHLTMLVGNPIADASPIVILLLALATIGVLAAADYFALRHLTSRARLLAATNPRLAELNGLSARSVFVFLGIALTLVATGLLTIYRAIDPAITPESVSVVLGLSVLAFAELLGIAGLVVVFPLILLLYGLGQFVWAGEGISLEGFLGLALVALVIFAPRLRVRNA